MKVLIGNLGRPGRAKTASRRTLRRRANRGTRAVWWGIGFEPRDLWVGVHWNRVEATGWTRAVDVYVCIVPCLPLKLQLRRMLPDPAARTYTASAA